ncbi:NrdH-redoxin [Thalassobacillus devorans]|uniref:NrdH-redoxin n=1 Tax=Thalassobacillus devorans TaxID=279813 RepID=A0ABQ1NKJ4_9BACI|nr:glutaredoxin family protein [Thalassobacillus devorans]NIK27648.1 glutaredoxin-like YruB-family protein [Thalassobacillus devorans]GGC79424.1 NrdH-redoxin [Thalassobacillus devorans]
MVTVYTTSTCPYCTMVKQFLDQMIVSYKEVNLENDPEEGRKLVETTGEMGVPQTNIDGQWVIGFDPETFLKYLPKQ